METIAQTESTKLLQAEVPELLMRRVKAEAATRGLSVKALVIEILVDRLGMPGTEGQRKRRNS